MSVDDIKAWINWETPQSKDDQERDDLLSKIALTAVEALEGYTEYSEHTRVGEPAVKALASIRETLGITEETPDEQA